MLFKNARAQQGGGFKNMHVAGQGVVRVANGMLRKMPLERGYHAQARVFVGCGIVEHAVQQSQLVALFFNPLHGFGNFVQMRRAGGKYDGLFEAAQNADKGLVGNIGRRNFEHVHKIIEKMC